jgi:outer membrane protein OmpA-like peptidoglycan-associated protein
VQFAFDSAEILPETKPQLDSLAAGIRLLPPNQAVVIEGHTDSRGTDFYNEVLSRKRASTVRNYLVTVAGIEPTRLRTIGLGRGDPLPGRDPMAPENRRVQFHGE